jgi:hypothetical protein
VDHHGRSALPARYAVCDVSAITRPDLRTVDQLARLQLIAMRRGRRICLRGACPLLVELIDLAGMTSLLPIEPGSGLQSRRQPE